MVVRERLENVPFMACVAKTDEGMAEERREVTTKLETDLESLSESLAVATKAFHQARS